MTLEDFKQSNTDHTINYVNDTFCIYQQVGKNLYSVLSSVFLSGQDWDDALRYKGTLNQVKKFLTKY